MANAITKATSFHLALGIVVYFKSLGNIPFCVE